MEDVYARLRHTCATLEEYRAIQTPPDEGIGRRSTLTVTNASSDKFDMWVRVLNMSASEARTFEGYATVCVDVYPPRATSTPDDASTPQGSLPVLTRMVTAVMAQGRRNPSSYPTSLDLWLAEDADGESGDYAQATSQDDGSGEEGSREEGSEGEPDDYHFLCWLWENLESFSSVESDEVLQEYVENTGRLSPYAPESEKRFRKLESTFQRELDGGSVPELIGALEEFDTVPKDEAVLASLIRCTARYYGAAYTSGILSRHRLDRESARRRDRHWDTKVRLSTAWYGGIFTEDDEVKELGTTNLDCIRRLRDEYTLLYALEPSVRYEVVYEEDEGLYTYEGATPVGTDESWDEDLIRRLIAEGYVVGPLIYTTREDAVDMQEWRCLPEEG
jgi:hypothetical protein